MRLLFDLRPRLLVALLSNSEGQLGNAVKPIFKEAAPFKRAPRNDSLFPVLIGAVRQRAFVDDAEAHQALGHFLRDHCRARYRSNCTGQSPASGSA